MDGQTRRTDAREQMITNTHLAEIYMIHVIEIGWEMMYLYLLAISNYVDSTKQIIYQALIQQFVKEGV